MAAYPMIIFLLSGMQSIPTCWALHYTTRMRRHGWPKHPNISMLFGIYDFILNYFTV